MRNSFLFFFLIFFFAFNAQDISLVSITGHVLDVDNVPIPNVSVSVNDQKTKTNENGKFLLSITEIENVEIQFNDDSGEVDKIDTIYTVELEKHVDQPKNDSLDKSSAQDSSVNVYVVFIMTVLHYQRYIFD